MSAASDGELDIAKLDDPNGLGDIVGAFRLKDAIRLGNASLRPRDRSDRAGDNRGERTNSPRPGSGLVVVGLPYRGQ